MAGNAADPGRSVTSKVVAILQTFSQGDQHSLSELVHRTGLPMSTVHRLAMELVGYGILERVGDANYRVGAPLKAIGNVDDDPPTLQERGRAVMEDLVATTRCDVRLGILEGAQVAYVEKRAGHGPVSTPSTSGRLPVHATALGKALLAFSPLRTVDAVVARGLKRYTPDTVTTPEGLRRALAETRMTFVAVASRELAPNECGIAAPVFGAGGVLAALELKVADLGIATERHRPALLVAARGLSRELARLGIGAPSAGLPGERPPGRVWYARERMTTAGRR
jgi:DNA-binding IclR family transcriptional regulator